MKVGLGSRRFAVSSSLAVALSSALVFAQPPKPASASAAPAAAAAAAAPAGPDTRSAAMAAYNRALAERRLEASQPLTSTILGERLLEVQELQGAGRRD